jgi:lipoprotein-releasing system permease protein
MIVAIAVITGFKREIKQKVVGFGSHIQITNYDSNQSLETNPIPTNLPVIDEVKKVKGVRHIQRFAIKAGIIKTDTDIQGVFLKGIIPNSIGHFFHKNLVDGRYFKIPTQPNHSIAYFQNDAANLLK